MRTPKFTTAFGGVHSEQWLSYRTGIKGQDGFSLVEVVLCIGIVAFAFLAIFSLLPIGMGIFHEAMDTSVSAQIVQRVVSDAEQTDFDVLKDVPGNEKTGNYYVLPLRYFDDQGFEVKVANAAAPSPAEQLKILYTVRIRGTMPGNSNPNVHTSDYPTSLPSKGSSRFNPRDETFLTVQIVNNPGNRALAPLINDKAMLDATKAKSANVPLQTYSVVIARNR